MSSLIQTARKLEHDRKCQPFWSFHQREGKHLVGVTSLPMDTNSQNGKSRLDSSSAQDGAMLSSNNNHAITDYYLTPMWPWPLCVPLQTTWWGQRGHLGLHQSWMRLTWTCSSRYAHDSGYGFPLSSESQGQTSLCYLSFQTKHNSGDICLQ